MGFNRSLPLISLALFQLGFPLAPFLFSSAHASQPIIIFARPGDADEDPVDVLIDSLVVGRVDSRSKATIVAPHGQHWLILRYGPRTFFNNNPMYTGAQVRMRYDSTLAFVIGYKSYAKRFFHVKVSYVTLPELAKVESDTFLTAASFRYDSVLARISPDKFEDIVEDIRKDTATFSISPNKIRLKIPEGSSSDSGRGEEQAPAAAGMSNLDTVNVGELLTLEQIRRKIVAARIVKACGIPLLAAGSALATAGIIVTAHGMMGRGTDNSSQNLIIGGGAVLLAGGIVCVRIGSDRIERFKRLERTLDGSMELGVNYIRLRIDFF